MSESDFYAPTDADVLRMENELLGFEVRFLKARLGGSAEGRRTLVDRRAVSARSTARVVRRGRRCRRLDGGATTWHPNSGSPPSR